MPRHFALTATLLVLLSGCVTLTFVPAYMRGSPGNPATLIADAVIVKCRDFRSNLDVLGGVDRDKYLCLRSAGSSNSEEPIVAHVPKGSAYRAIAARSQGLIDATDTMYDLIIPVFSSTQRVLLSGILRDYIVGPEPKK